MLPLSRPWRTLCARGCAPHSDIAYGEVSASSRRQLRPVSMAARQKASSITLRIRSHPDGSRHRVRSLVIDHQPSRVPVAVDVRRTNQRLRVGVAAKELLSITPKLFPEGDTATSPRLDELRASLPWVRADVFYSEGVAAVYPATPEVPWQAPAEGLPCVRS